MKEEGIKRENKQKEAMSVRRLYRQHTNTFNIINMTRYTDVNIEIRKTENNTECMRQKNGK